ncbi:hypothetical protein A3767_27915 [Oleiphilus sp. HI0133]|nr:hypothetical protein A3767_27915 [Oleiphilus sp. HI0133]
MSVICADETLPVDHEFDQDLTNFAAITPSTQLSSSAALDEPCTETVPLIQLAYARSGDKGNHSNIGVIARKPEYLPFIQAALSEQAVTAFMQHTLDKDTGKVRGWAMPGFDAMNFLLENSLGGGGVASLRIDPQGKAFAQQLLEFPIPISAKLAGELCR